MVQQRAPQALVAQAGRQCQHITGVDRAVLQRRPRHRSALCVAEARLQKRGQESDALLGTARPVAHQVPDVEEAFADLVTIAAGLAPAERHSLHVAGLFEP